MNEFEFIRYKDIVLYNGECIEILDKLAEDNSFDSLVTDPPYELGFMGKSWDKAGISFNTDTWRMIISKLKPGAHACVFGGTRTQHRIACAMEDAGFEIIDQLDWLFGLSSPKSKKVCDGLEEELEKYEGSKKELIMDMYDIIGGDDAEEMKSEYDEYEKKIIDLIEKFNGWGTALKTGHEPIILAKKPLIGTVKNNVIKYGTGGINVDGCRRGNEKVKINRYDGLRPFGGGSGEYKTVEEEGRWPSNILLSHSPMCEEVKNGVFKCLDSCPVFQLYVKHKNSPDFFNIVDNMFEYSPKANVKERERGCENLNRKEGSELTGRKPGSAGLKHPRAGTARDGAKNFHPTVKPIKIMRWLVRLVTPSGGICLDPFVGSGTTGIAAHLEGCKLFGIERDKEYFKIAINRCHEWTKQDFLFD